MVMIIYNSRKLSVITHRNFDMEELVDVKISQRFLIFCACSSKLYNITLQGSSLDLNSNYFVHYNFPDNTVNEAKAEAVSEYELLVKGPPEFDHPCTVDVEVCVNDSEQCLAKFSLDLVSPVEYLFRSLCLDDQEISSKISLKMNSAMLAMSLSYYYVMGEDVNKEEMADQILSTLLKHNTNDGSNGSGKRIGNSSNMMQFARRHRLHHTLRCLSVEDHPIQPPKSKFDVPLILPKDKDPGEAKLPVKPRISPRNFPNTHQPPDYYASLTGPYKTESEKSEYTELLREHTHKVIEEPRRKQKIQRDQSYEEVKEGMLNQDYEEINDELLYEVPKDIQPYEEPINALKKEKPYDEPDDTTDQPLESPIYIVPDPEEQNRIENLYQHVNVQNTTTNGEHHLHTEKKAIKHRRSKSLEFLDYTEVKSSPPARPPPPIFSKGTSSNKTGLTTYNTLSRLGKRSVLQTFSSVRPDHDGTSPQLKEKPAVKIDLMPSPKPRHVSKIYL